MEFNNMTYEFNIMTYVSLSRFQPTIQIIHRGIRARFGVCTRFGETSQLKIRVSWIEMDNLQTF